jgi:ABC-type nitrate/sulfonate/bicarbonate transport system ATPase subunit
MTYEIDMQGTDLKILELTKAFGQKKVLQQLDLEVAPGEFVAIVGRSGCGKSTLLRLIAGLETPTSGGVLIDGEPLGKLNQSARMMFQDERLLLWKRVLENVGLGQRGNWEPQARWALEQVGLGDRIIVLRGNPGRIHQEFKLDLPRPRRRTDIHFQNWKERILKALDLSTEERSRSVLEEKLI